MIWVRPRAWVEKSWIPELPTAVISITTPGDAPADLPEDPDIVRGVLRLQFHDLNEDVEDFKAMTPEQAKEVVEFLLNLPPVACVLVHCDAGISRSAGVAAAISRALYGGDSYFFINYLPNRRCYKLVLEAFLEMTDLLK